MKNKIVFLTTLLVSHLGCAGLIMDTYVPPGSNPEINYEFNYDSSKGSKLADPLAFLLIASKPTIESLSPPADKANTFSGMTDDSLQNQKSVIEHYSTAIVDDLKEILTDKNFRLVQLLEDQQKATFSQREQSNFSLVPKVAIEIKDKRISSVKPGGNFGKALLKQIVPGEVTGKLSIRARISLEVQEPITWQLIWIKSLDTEAFEAEYSYKWNYVLSGQNVSYVIGEDTRPQALASILMKSYGEILDNLSTYIDVKEFALLNKQAMDVRKKATGIIK